MTCTIITLYSAKCEQCGAHPQFDYDSVEKARKWCVDHEADHARWARTGALIGAGNIFNPNDPDVGWIGHIAKAVKVASELQLPYLLWNGAVYATSDPLGLVVCYEEDVEGLKR